MMRRSTVGHTPRASLVIAILVIAIVTLGSYRLWWKTSSSSEGGGGRAPDLLPSSSALAVVADLDVRPSGSIAGRVTSAEPPRSGAAGASVCVVTLRDARRVPSCVTTDGDGAYRFRDLAPARYSVTAAFAHAIPMSFRDGASDVLTLGPGEAREHVDITLGPQGVEVRGVVRDLSGGVVAGASVVVSSGEEDGSGGGDAVTQSGEDGEWSAWVAPGNVQASAIADGYAPAWAHGVAPGQRLELVVVPESVLQGRVVEAGTEQPVAGARVRAGPMAGYTSEERDASVATDAEGRFRIARLEPGRYKPRVTTRHGWGVATESVLLGLAETSGEITIVVSPAHTVSGRVVFPNGEVCRVPSVIVKNKVTDVERRGEGEPDGTVRITALLAGNYRVAVSCPDGLEEASYPDLTLAGEDIQGVEWKVVRGFRVSGAVVDATGAKVAFATVSAREKRTPTAAHASSVPARSMPHWVTATTDASGAFVLRGLLSATYGLEVYREGATPLEDAHGLDVDRDLEGIRIALPLGGTLEGVVVDALGAPVARAGLEAVSRGGAERSSTSRDDGTFVFKGMKPGEYKIRALGRRAPQTKDEDPRGSRLT